MHLNPYLNASEVPIKYQYKQNTKFSYNISVRC